MAGTVWDFQSFPTEKQFLLFWISDVIGTSGVLGDTKSWEYPPVNLNLN